MKIKDKLIGVVLLLLVCMSVFGVKVYSATRFPKPYAYVNDFASILSSDTEDKLNSLLKQVEEKTTAQIVVATVKNMNGADIESYAVELFNEWKIGDKQKDNGILFIIAHDERKVRIEVGYGANTFLNAGKAGRILDNVALPYLKDNNYDVATINTVNELKAIVYNEYGIEGGYDNYEDDDDLVTSAISIFMTSILPFLIIMFIAIFSRGRIPFFYIGGPRGPFGGHGGGFGGGSFGGFSGGGGSSGGGGASRGF